MKYRWAEQRVTHGRQTRFSCPAIGFNAAATPPKGFLLDELCPYDCRVSVRAAFYAIKAPTKAPTLREKCRFALQLCHFDSRQG